MDTFWGAIGGVLSSILSSYGFDAITRLTTWLSPVALSLFTLWLILTGWQYMAGHGPEMPDFVRRAAGIALVITFATSAGLIAGPVFTVFDDLRGSLAAAFVPTSAGGCTAANPWQALDCMATQANAQLQTIRVAMARLSFYELGELIPLVLLWLSVAAATGILQLVNAFVIALGTFLGAFGIALAPLSILALMFQPTRSFFSAWLSFMINVAVLSAVSMFALGVSIGLADWFNTRINAAGGVLDSPMDPLLVGLLFFSVHGMLAILVYQGPSISAMVVGGGGFGQGGGLVQSILLLSRLGPSQPPSPPAPTAGGPAGGTVSPARRATAAGAAAGRATAQVGQAAARAGRYVYEQIAARGRRT